MGLSSAYRYEVYADQDLASRMLSGGIVPADNANTEVSKLVMTHLSNNSEYWWRVVAIDENGLVHGASKLRRFTTP